MRISSPPPQLQREQRRAWQDDGCRGLSRSGVAAGPIVPHSKKDSPTLHHSGILTQIPQLHTHKGRALCWSDLPGEGRLF